MLVDVLTPTERRRGCFCATPFGLTSRFRGEDFLLGLSCFNFLVVLIRQECRTEFRDRAVRMPPSCRGSLPRVLLGSFEVQISRKPALRADEDFSQACAALEGEPIQIAAFRKKLKQERQPNFFLRDHDVAQPRFIGVTLHLSLREHS